MDLDLSDRVAYAIVAGVCAFCLLLIAAEEQGWI